MTTKTHSKTSVFKHLLPYLFLFKWRIIISIFLLVFARVLSVADPYIIKSLVDTLASNDSTTVNLTLLGILIALFFVLRWGSDLIEGVKTYIFAKAETNIKRLIALDVFKHLLSLSMDFHTNRATGGVSRKITRGANGLETMLFFIAGTVLPTFVEIALIISVFLYLFPISFSYTMLGFIISYFAFTVWAANRRQKILLITNELDDAAASQSIDALMNYENVKYFNNEEYVHKKYGEKIADWVASDILSTKTGANLNIGQGLIIAVGTTILLFLAANQYLSGSGTIGDFVLITTYISRISVPLSFLGFMYLRIKEGIADADAMFALMDVKNTVSDKPDAQEMTNTNGKIEFKNVTFGYGKDTLSDEAVSREEHKNSRIILKDINLVFEEKKSTALVGYSGSGKSTISKLILRLYDPLEGSVLVDGVDVRDLKQKSLREHIGIVAQDTLLFNDTIYNNILYGRPSATKEEVIEATKIANIHEFIENLPKGYDTMVGERGVKLSGGEKQRLAIARMMLKRPAILIFDEATASLDSHSEKIIQESIEELSKGGRTSIVIAHRLSTIVNADKIIVMENGEVKEEGTHDELLKQEGIYYRLWTVQQKEE